MGNSSVLLHSIFPLLRFKYLAGLLGDTIRNSRVSPFVLICKMLAQNLCSLKQQDTSFGCVCPDNEKCGFVVHAAHGFTHQRPIKIFGGPLCFACSDCAARLNALKSLGLCWKPFRQPVGQNKFLGHTNCRSSKPNIRLSSGRPSLTQQNLKQVRHLGLSFNIVATIAGSEDLPCT